MAHDMQSPFPLHTEKYAYRVDPFEAMTLNIYRDRYEQIVSSDRPARRIQRLADFPEFAGPLPWVYHGDTRQIASTPVVKPHVSQRWVLITVYHPLELAIVVVEHMLLRVEERVEERD